MTQSFTYENARDAKFETLQDVREALFCIRALTSAISDRLFDEVRERKLQGGTKEREEFRVVQRLVEDKCWLAAREACLLLEDLI
jgi:hypothetical protein